jgi:hypothetical protein
MDMLPRTTDADLEETRRGQHGAFVVERREGATHSSSAITFLIAASFSAESAWLNSIRCETANSFSYKRTPDRTQKTTTTTATCHHWIPSTAQRPKPADRPPHRLC